MCKRCAIHLDVLLFLTNDFFHVQIWICTKIYHLCFIFVSAVYIFEKTRHPHHWIIPYFLLTNPLLPPDSVSEDCLLGEECIGIRSCTAVVQQLQKAKATQDATKRNEIIQAVRDKVGPNTPSRQD